MRVKQAMLLAAGLGMVSQPVWADGILYFTSGENRVYALDAHKGGWIGSGPTPDELRRRQRRQCEAENGHYQDCSCFHRIPLRASIGST